MILLDFQKNKFSTQQKIAYGKLEKIQDDGFGFVLTDILKHREYINENFKQVFDENKNELTKELPDNFSDRTLNHVAMILAPVKLLIKKLKLPFSFNEITQAVVENAINQNNLLKQTDEITIFWQAFAYGIKNGTLIKFGEVFNNKKNSHYNFKNTKAFEDILQIKLHSTYPEYVKYCKNNSLRFLDSNSLKMLITSKANKAFIPNTQKGRGAAFTDKYFGSCYQFWLENNENIFTINEVEINM